MGCTLRFVSSSSSSYWQLGEPNNENGEVETPLIAQVGGLLVRKSECEPEAKTILRGHGKVLTSDGQLHACARVLGELGVRV